MRRFNYGIFLPGLHPEVGTVGDDAIDGQDARVGAFEGPEFDFALVPTQVAEEGGGEAAMPEVEAADVGVFIVAETGETAVDDIGQERQFHEEEFLEADGGIELVEVFQGEVVEALHSDPACGVVLIDLLQEAFLQSLIDVAGALDFHEELYVAACGTGLAHELEHFFEGGQAVLRGHSVGIEDMELAQFEQREVADAAIAIGGAVHGLVVTDDDVSVAREVDVYLYHVGTLGDAAPEGGKGVFGGEGGAPAMGYDFHCCVFLRGWGGMEQRGQRRRTEVQHRGNKEDEQYVYFFIHFSQFFPEEMTDEDADGAFVPAEAVAGVGSGGDGLDGEVLDSLDAKQRVHEEVSELMGHEVAEGLAAGVVVEDVLAVGACAGEGEADDFLLDEEIDLGGEVVLGGGEDIADEAHEVVLVNSPALASIGGGAFDAVDVLLGREAAKDVEDEAEGGVDVPHIGDELRDVFYEVPEEFAVVLADGLVDELAEDGYGLDVAAEGVAVAGVGTIDGGIPAHDVSLVESGGVGTVATSSGEESAAGQRPLAGLAGIGLEEFCIEVSGLYRHLIEDVEHRHLAVAEVGSLTEVSGEESTGDGLEVFPGTDAHDDQHSLEHEVTEAVAGAVGRQDGWLQGGPPLFLGLAFGGVAIAAEKAVVVAEMHGLGHVGRTPADAVAGVVGKGPGFPEGLVLHSVVDIVGLEGDLPFHGDLEEGHEEAYEGQIRGEIAEDALEFAEHVADDGVGVGYGRQHVVDDHHDIEAAVSRLDIRLWR